MTLDRHQRDHSVQSPTLFYPKAPVCCSREYQYPSHRRFLVWTPRIPPLAFSFWIFPFPMEFPMTFFGVGKGISLNHTMLHTQWCNALASHQWNNLELFSVHSKRLCKGHSSSSSFLWIILRHCISCPPGHLVQVSVKINLIKITVLIVTFVLDKEQSCVLSKVN